MIKRPCILAIEGKAFPQTATAAREFTTYLKHLVSGCVTTVLVMVFRNYRTRSSNADIPYSPPLGLAASMPRLFAITDLVAAMAVTASAAPRCQLPRRRPQIGRLPSLPVDP